MLQQAGWTGACGILALLQDYLNLIEQSPDDAG